jgi:hypothetical protein
MTAVHGREYPSPARDRNSDSEKTPASQNARGQPKARMDKQPLKAQSLENEYNKVFWRAVLAPVEYHGLRVTSWERSTTSEATASMVGVDFGTVCMWLANATSIKSSTRGCCFTPRRWMPGLLVQGQAVLGMPSFERMVDECCFHLGHSFSDLQRSACREEDNTHANRRAAHQRQWFEKRWVGQNKPSRTRVA